VSNPLCGLAAPRRRSKTPRSGGLNDLRSLEITIMDCITELITTKEIPERTSSFGYAMQSHLLLRHQLSAARAELHRELKVVGEIQRSLLPETLPEIPGFDIASYYKPSAMAGGDYYDIVPLVDGLWGLIVADVAGHGASAAVVMAMMRTLVHAHLPTNRYLPSCEFLEFMNRQMTGVYTRDGRFVTVWAAVLDPAARTMTYASAGHNPPRHVRRATVTALDAARGLPLGIEQSEKYEEVCVSLEAGDLVVIYTDGITEAARFGDGGRRFFETERLDEVLIESRCDTAEDCVIRVTKSVNTFTEESEQTDDQTMLVLRVK
jgi:sigma-B regulation protein RsbU (phosphoserine phosphatase)